MDLINKTESEMISEQQTGFDYVQSKVYPLRDNNGNGMYYIKLLHHIKSIKGLKNSVSVKTGASV